MATTVESTNRLLTNERDAVLARQVLDALQGPNGFLSAGSPGNQHPVPVQMGELLQRVLESVSVGGTITVMTVPPELTTSAAASLIGVSRPTLMKMIAGGAIPTHKVGTHTRLTSADVFAFIKARHERQVAAFNDLRNMLDH